MTYEQAFEDHQYLWGIGPAYDMTGGYVDQEDLMLLLKSPTKSTAKRCLVSQIEYWFQTGTYDEGRRSDSQKYIDSDPTVEEIYNRHMAN